MERLNNGHKKGWTDTNELTKSVVSHMYFKAQNINEWKDGLLDG